MCIFNSCIWQVSYLVVDPFSKLWRCVPSVCTAFRWNQTSGLYWDQVRLRYRMSTCTLRSLLMARLHEETCIETCNPQPLWKIKFGSVSTKTGVASFGKVALTCTLRKVVRWVVVYFATAHEILFSALRCQKLKRCQKYSVC